MSRLPQPLAKWCERVTGLLIQNPSVSPEDKQLLTQDLDGILRWAGIDPKTRYRLQTRPPAEDPPNER